MPDNLLQFSLLGLSHESTPVEVREKAAFSNRDSSDALHALKRQGIESAVILSTCNRSEIYAIAKPEQLIELFSWRSGGAISATSGYLYSYTAESAVRHLFEVACGLHSQVLGENQILGQIRKSFFSSRSMDCVSGILHEIFERAIKVGKLARSSTQINYGSVSLATLSSQMLRTHLSPDAKIAIVGTGEMGTKVAKELAGVFSAPLTIFSHTNRFAQNLATEVGGIAAAMTDFRSDIVDFDAIICATEAPHPILDASAFTARKHPLLVVDLGMPRNVDENVRSCEAVKLANLDDLKAQVDDSFRIRNASIPAALQVVEREVAALSRWCSERRVAPIIRALDAHKTLILEEELHSFAKKLSAIPNAEQILEQFGRRLLNRALNPQIDRVKEISREERTGWELLGELYEVSLELEEWEAIELDDAQLQ